MKKPKPASGPQDGPQDGAPPGKQEMPQEGGSWLRREDGTLERRPPARPAKTSRETSLKERQ